MNNLRGSNVQIGQKSWKNDNVSETKQQFKAPNDYAALQEKLKTMEAKASLRASNVPFSNKSAAISVPLPVQQAKADNKSYAENHNELNRLKAEQKVTHFKMGFEDKSLSGSNSTKPQKRMSTLAASGSS